MDYFKTRDIMMNHSKPTIIDMRAFHENIPEELIRLVEIENDKFGAPSQGEELNFSILFQLYSALLARFSTEVQKLSTKDFMPIRTNSLFPLS
ncbi:hypothetical protein HDU97_006895 [Phlyctochytrium planicorne]|nr:hypothetical protein HDU97_006895 [Phlyctochytrium planicorne]